MALVLFHRLAEILGKSSLYFSFLIHVFGKAFSLGTVASDEPFGHCPRSQGNLCRPGSAGASVGVAEVRLGAESHGQDWVQTFELTLLCLACFPNTSVVYLGRTGPEPSLCTTQPSQFLVLFCCLQRGCAHPTHCVSSADTNSVEDKCLRRV